MVKLLNPEGVERRAKDLQRVRGEYIVPGLDFIWSIDGHDKLAAWGIKIYAGVDAYCRNIIWCYVGVSNRTTNSVLAQYLQTCRQLGYSPNIVRSDRGTETPMLAEVHYGTRRAMAPDLQFDECFFYGTSVHNQRIESWWSQLQKSQLYFWRVSISCNLIVTYYCYLLICI